MIDEISNELRGGIGKNVKNQCEASSLIWR